MWKIVEKYKYFLCKKLKEEGDETRLRRALCCAVNLILLKISTLVVKHKKKYIKFFHFSHPTCSPQYLQFVFRDESKKMRATRSKRNEQRLLKDKYWFFFLSFSFSLSSADATCKKRRDLWKRRTLFHFFLYIAQNSMYIPYIMCVCNIYGQIRTGRHAWNEYNIFRKIPPVDHRRGEKWSWISIFQSSFLWLLLFFMLRWYLVCRCCVDLRI